MVTCRLALSFQVRMDLNQAFFNRGFIQADFKLSGTQLLDREMLKMENTQGQTESITSRKNFLGLTPRGLRDTLLCETIFESSTKVTE